MRSKYTIALPVIILLTFFSCNSEKQQVPGKQISKTKNTWQLKELNTAQISSLDKNKTVVLIPGGIMEEHGPYLPSFSDGYWNEKFTDTLAKTIAAEDSWSVLVFPLIPLGNSGANDIGMKYSFPGTYTVRFETLRSVFMDIATELSEQGFKYVFIIHAHGAPNHNRALDQAADYFSDTYKGKMINLMGLNEAQMNWFEAAKTKEEEKEDGMKMHGGMSETSSMLYIVPHLVNSHYKTAVPFSGQDMDTLISIAKRPEWMGYFGSERLATAKYGEEAWNNNIKMLTRLSLDILNNKINPDTLPRFGDFMKQSKPDVLLDSLSLKEEQRRKENQEQWLKSKRLF